MGRDPPFMKPSADSHDWKVDTHVRELGRTDPSESSQVLGSCRQTCQRYHFRPLPDCSVPASLLKFKIQVDTAELSLCYGRASPFGFPTLVRLRKSQYKRFAEDKRVGVDQEESL